MTTEIRSPAGGADGRLAADRPPEPSDYRALNLAYGALLTALLAADRARPEPGEPIRGPELVPLAAATFALSKIISREKIGAWVREPFVHDEGTEHRRPRGAGVRHALGELVTCSRCVGAWSALGLVGVRTLSPAAGRTVTSVLALSAANDWLQAGFRFTTACVNRAQRDTT
jgi:hypothetical protein